MNNTINELDSKIYAFNKEFDILNLVSPQNINEENKKFLEKYDKEIVYNPIYVYKEIDSELLEEYEKYLSSVNLSDTTIGNVYRQYIDYLKDVIKFIRGIGNSYLVTENSIKLFSKPSPDLVKKAKEVLEEKKGSKSSSNKFYDATVLEDAFNTRLKEIGISGYDVVLTDKIPFKVNVEPFSKKVYINSEVLYSEADIKRLLVHEIDTHVKRSENGQFQKYKIFSYGFPKYLETEEGLAVFNQSKHNLIDEEMFRTYAARVVAVDMALNNSFYDVFNYLTKYVDKNEALRITSRVKRGLSNTMEKGAFVKDVVYFSGYDKIRNNLLQNDVPYLYSGLVGIEDIETVKKLVDEDEIIIQNTNL